MEDLPIVRIILLRKRGSEEEGLVGPQRGSASRKLEKRMDLQSTKPFQAETEARRAVSTVPPMTTSFWQVMSSLFMGV